MGPDIAIVSYVAVIIGVFLVLFQMKQSYRLREGQVFLNVMSLLLESDVLGYWLTLSNGPYQSYEEVLKEPDPKKREEFMVALHKLVVTFEGIGVIVKRGIVPLGAISDYIPGLTRESWLRAWKVIEGYRESTRHYEYGEWWEYLYLRIYSSMSDADALRRLEENRKRGEAKRLSSKTVD